MRALSMLAVLVPSMVAHADSKLTMRYSDSSNTHIANQGGAINYRADIAVIVDLATAGTVTATSTGTRVDHNLFPGANSRSTDDTTTWTTRWKGTWKSTATTLALELTLIDHACKRELTTTEYDGRTKQWVTYQPEIRSCRTAAKQTKLACTAEQLSLDDKSKLAAWRCVPTASTDLAESPAMWVFGKTECIETRGGKAALAYARCAP